MADWQLKCGFFRQRAAAPRRPCVAGLLAAMAGAGLALACGQAPPMRPVGPALAKSSPTERSKGTGTESGASNKSGRGVAPAEPAAIATGSQTRSRVGEPAPQGASPDAVTDGAESRSVDTAPVSQTPPGPGETTMNSGPGEALTQATTVPPSPAPTPAPSLAPPMPGDPGGWLLYDAEVQSCYPSYSGPSLLLDGGSGQLDTSKFGPSLPYCDASRKGQAFCTSRPDGSPSNCFMCQENLFLCP